MTPSLRPAGLRPLLLLAVVTALVAALLAATAGGADARKARKRVAQWAPAATASITPGTQMYTGGQQCTANFVFTDADGHVYVGYAAHCAGLGAATDTDGCTSPTMPLGTAVTFVEGGSLVSAGTTVGRGTLAYSSWEAMQRLGTRDPQACAYNDFALVRVAPGDVGKVNPSVPFWGGPTGLDSDGTAPGDRVWSYGNSSLRGGLALLSPKTGTSLGDAAADRGWSHPVYTLTPGIPGDSGSGFLSAGGKAVGTLSTLGLLPLPLSNGVGDLARELAFARDHSGLRGLRLVEGTEPFSPLL